MFNFLFVSANQGGGGSEELWIQTASVLAQKGHKVAALTEWNDSAARRKVQLSNLHIGHRSLVKSTPLIGKVARRLLNLRSASVERLNREIHRFKPHIAVINSGTLLDGLDYLEAIHANQLPCIVATHLVSTDNWPNDSTAFKISSGFAKALKVYFVSEHNRHLCFLQTGVHLSNTAIVRNPFLVKKTTSMPLIAADKTVKLALPARLHPRTKGHDILFEVLSRKHWHNRKLKVTILGSGSCESSLRSLSSSLGINEKVLFGGHVNDMELIWKEHHALVLPSRHEGLPIAQVEAMWAGRVVIATPAGGIPEVIENGITGFLAKCCNADSLDETLDHAWSRLSEWETIGTQASKSIRTIIPEDPALVWAEQLIEHACSLKSTRFA